MRARRSRGRLGVAMVLSPALHAGVAGVALLMPAMGGEEDGAAARVRDDARGRWVMVMPEEEPPPPEVEPQPVPRPPPEEEREPEVRPGIERSSLASASWIGFEDPTPHQATKSTVDQPALALEDQPPAGGVPVPPSAPPAAAAPMTMPAPASPPEAEPSEGARSPMEPAREAPRGTEDQGGKQPAPSETPKGEGEVTVKPAAPVSAVTPMIEEEKAAGPEDKGGEADAPAAEAAPGAPDRPMIDDPGDGDRSERVKAAAPSVEAPALPAAPDAASRDSLVMGPPAPAGAAAPSPTPSRNAMRSEKESDATAVDEPLEIRPGRPAAGEGLEIITRRPSFPRYAYGTNPKNPVLKVTFNRAGRVSKAEFVERSGYESVDEPILNAVYSWTAKGKAIAALASGKPDAGVTIRVRIILR